MRFGKGCSGSGPRQRLTILNDFCAQTIRVYLKHTRPTFARAAATQALFLTQQGNRVTYGAMRGALDKIVRLARQAKIEVPNSFQWHDPREVSHRLADKYPGELFVYQGSLVYGLSTIHRYTAE